jgi:hypothetical protein
MRNAIRTLWALPLLAAPLTARAQAADPAAPPAAQNTAPAPIISSNQIDRFGALTQLQNAVKENPKSLADWVILGELAHEVALDQPSDQAAKYNQMSLDAYEKALALAPNNPGLKAAVQFARDQASNQNQLETSRTQATSTYLDARRRDLAANNYTPSVRLASPAVTSQPVAANAAAPAAVPGGVNGRASSVAGSPVYTYRPLYTPSTTTPYTFRQYSSSYYPPNYYSAGTAPMSAQRYLQQSLMQGVNQRIFGGTGGVAPR